METQQEYLARVGLQKPKNKRRWKHGDAGASPLYGLWNDIKKRCYYKNTWNFKHYGGKGVRMCDEWFYNYPAFKKWAMDNGYAEGLQIHRIDNDGDYSPQNCKFLTPLEHAHCGLRFKLTPENVAKIVELREEGISNDEIAKTMNMSSRSVRKALQRYRESTTRNI